MADQRPAMWIYATALIVLFALTAPAGAGPYEPAWVPRFADLGMDNVVSALTVFDDGTGPALYAGGGFITAGEATVHKIARLDGNQWSPLGDGIGAGNGLVWVMTEFDDGSGPALYVAGGFDVAGGQVVNHIAKWDGSTWSPVGGGTDAMIRGALTVFDDGSGPALYAGGEFTRAGSVEANHVAKWDGQQWSALGTGMTGAFASVRALIVFDDGTGPALYAGGSFVFAGDVTANGIAKWDGQAWFALGSGVGHENPDSRLVRGLGVYDDGTGPALYAAGQFTSAGSVPAHGIAKWDGHSWSALGDGISADPEIISTPTGRRITVFDDGSGPALYLCGTFTIAGGQTVNYIAKWDGTAWSSLERGMNDTVFALTTFDEGDGPALFAGGAFTTAGDITSLRIAKWMPRCTGDLDGDDDIDLADLAILLGNYGRAGDMTCPDGDLDGDADVDLADLAALLAVYGTFLP